VVGVVNDWAKRQAPRTVRGQYGTLRAIRNYAVIADMIVRSPCRGIKLPAIPHDRHHVVSADELARLSDAMDDHGLMAYVAAVVASDGVKSPVCVSAPSISSQGVSPSARPSPGA
jgi:hypothetical protein